MQKNECPICCFLKASKGNWRNSIFIECSKCKLDAPRQCGGFLLVSDEDGKPIILPEGSLCRILRTDIDKAECVALISRAQFEVLYSLWIDWNIDSPKDCALMHLTRKCICV